MLDNLNYKDLLKLLSKELLTLEISDDAVLKNDITHCIDQILQEQTLDPKIIKNLKDFKEMLQGTYRESLTFSSSRAPPAAAPEEHDPDHISDPDEPPEAPLDEEEPPKDPKEVPQINKSSLQKDDSVLTQSSPAKPAPAPAPASPVVPQTPTTFGADNTSGMKSLRKSMNVSDRNVAREVFKVPDANATKKLRQKLQKAADKKTKPDKQPEKDESDESPASPESDEPEPAAEESFAIPSTQDISGVSSIDGDRSILHLEIPETQRPMEGQSTPIQRTPTKRKISHGSTEEEEEEIVDSSPNVVVSFLFVLGGASTKNINLLMLLFLSQFQTSHRDRSMVRPAASAKSIAKSQSAAKVEQPRTRNTARKEIINTKVMTRKSLTDITGGIKGSKRGSLTGIEPLERSPPVRRKDRSSGEGSKMPEKSTKKDSKTTPAVAKPPSKRLAAAADQEKPASANKEAAKEKEPAEKSKSTTKKQTNTAKKAEEAKTDSPAIRTSRRNLNKDDSSVTSSSKKNSEKQAVEKKTPANSKKSAPEKPSPTAVPSASKRTTRKSSDKSSTPSSEKPEKGSTRSASKPVPPEKPTSRVSLTRQNAVQESASSTPTAASKSQPSSNSSTKNPVKRTMSTRGSKGSIAGSPAASLSVSSIGSDSSTMASPVRPKRTAVTPLSGESAVTTRSTSTPTRPARKAAKK